MSACLRLENGIFDGVDCRFQRIAASCPAYDSHRDRQCKPVLFYFPGLLHPFPYRSKALLDIPVTFRSEEKGKLIPAEAVHTVPGTDFTEISADFP